MESSDSRHHLFEAARRKADWTVEQLWVHYLGQGGSLLFFDLEAYLSGLTFMPPAQQDVLASALNERLADLYLSAQVPYLFTTLHNKGAEDALQVLEELLDSARQGEIQL